MKLRINSGVILLLCCVTNAEYDWWQDDKEIADGNKIYKVKQSALQFQVSFGAEFPVEVQPANNNVGIEM